MAKREKYIGSAPEKRRYDLPLNKDAGTGFLLLLIALMVFLATLALASSFTLSAMAQRWTSGLEGRITVEIPAQDDSGRILNRAEMSALASRLVNLLESTPSVQAAHALDNEEISALVEPWIGTGAVLESAPLPSLISIELKTDERINVRTMEERIKSIAPWARLETHESWLKDVLRLTGALQFAAAILALVICVTTIIAVAGAIRSRMAVHHEVVSLLHLMGASDNYIARQFQHHSLFLALKGALGGMIAGMLSIWVIGRIAGSLGVSLLPDFHLAGSHITILLLIPFFAAIIAAITARRTVYRVLEDMP